MALKHCRNKEPIKITAEFKHKLKEDIKRKLYKMRKMEKKQPRLGWLTHEEIMQLKQDKARSKRIKCRRLKEKQKNPLGWYNGEGYSSTRDVMERLRQTNI